MINRIIAKQYVHAHKFILKPLLYQPKALRSNYTKNILDDQSNSNYQGSAISQSKSQLAQFGISQSFNNYMMKSDQQLRKTYVWKLIDYILFKTYYIEQDNPYKLQQNENSNQISLQKIQNRIIKTNNPTSQIYKFNKNTNQLLSDNQTIKQILNKQKSLSIKEFSTDIGQTGKGLYTINLGSVQSSRKSQIYFDSDPQIKKNLLLHDQVLRQKKGNDYEILLVGRKLDNQDSNQLSSKSNLDNSLIKNQIFQQSQLSQQIIAGSKFYEGVKYNQGIISYYVRKIYNIALLIVVFLMCAVWYGMSKSVWKRNQNDLKNQLARGLSSGRYNVSGFYQRTVKFFSQILTTKS